MDETSDSPRAATVNVGPAAGEVSHKAAYDGSSDDAAAPREACLSVARKGLIFGECGTAGCTNQARWISIHEARSAPQPFIYRCPPCCDRIDERMRP